MLNIPAQFIGTSCGPRDDVGQPNTIVQSLRILLVGQLLGNQTRFVQAGPWNGNEVIVCESWECDNERGGGKGGGGGIREWLQYLQKWLLALQ